MKNPFIHNEREFCDLIAEIGYGNRESLVWYASSVSSKNPGVSDFVRNVLNPESVNIPKKKPFRIFIVFLYYLFRTYLIAKPLLRLKRRGICKASKNSIVIFSHFSRNSWKNKVYKDLYLQEILDVFSENKTDVFIIGDTYGKIIDNINYSTERFKILPLELFITFSDILKAFFMTLSGKINLPENINFEGRDIRSILKKQFQHEKYNGEIFINICGYFAFSRIFRRIKPAKIYWPWENHSWEKLMLIAQKKFSSGTSSTGYQHSTIPPFLINHFPGKNECKYAPLPDRIVTVGNEPANILKTFGSFPEGLIEIGCAFRYKYLFDLKPWSGGLSEKKFIGVAFPLYKDTAEKILSFVCEAFKDSEHRILLKFHPLLSDKNVFKAYNRPIPPNIQVFKKTIPEFLDEISILIYSDTSTSTDATMLGIPSVYLDIGRGMSGNPLFNNDFLNWSASNAKELQARSKSIMNLSQDELNEQRRNARKYIMNYFNPVTEDKIKLFLEG